MTEAAWCACTDHPWDMLEYMLELSARPASQRKLRLYICACCRRVWHLLPDPASRKAVELAEQFADGTVTETDLVAARMEARELCGIGGAAHWPWLASGAACPLQYDFGGLLDLSNLAAHASDDESSIQCDLLRDVFGKPCRPPPRLPPAVLAWNDGAVRGIAEGIYKERAFDRLPILADALLDAGCDNEELDRPLPQRGAARAGVLGG